MDDAIRYRLLKLLHEQPQLTQREMAKAMGVSLGKANFCLRALIEVGAVKVNNFRSSNNKSGYLYLLTPRGLEEKAKVTRRFLDRKLADYETIQREIEELWGEMQQSEPFRTGD
jgi:EPS-associated MarR family transcriptional regulator